MHPKEFALILALRNKFPEGDVTIKMRSAVPQYISKVIQFDALSFES